MSKMRPARPIDNILLPQVDEDGMLLDVESLNPTFATLETCCVLGEDASLLSLPDVILSWESLTLKAPRKHASENDVC